jgi:RND family efflux transporter MFP subunit
VRPSGPFPRVGQTVKKGQVLAFLAPRLGGDTDQATLEAAAGKAKIALDQARRERERMESLFKDEAIPEKRLLEARANEQAAAAEAQAAQARQGQLVGTGGIAIRAPIDGTLADVAVAPGAFVADGAPLFHVANTGRLWLEARVPESEIGRLGTPSGASFSVDGFDRPFVIEPGRNGKLIAVGGVVDAATRTVPAIFEFANPGGLRLGMTAKAQLYAGQGVEGVLVPASAVQDESGTSVVYVQTGGESFERRIVRVGARDGEWVAILDGIEPGQRVVNKGGYLIRLSTSMSAAVGHAH